MIISYVFNIYTKNIFAMYSEIENGYIRRNISFWVRNCSHFKWLEKTVCVCILRHIINTLTQRCRKMYKYYHMLLNVRNIAGWGMGRVGERTSEYRVIVNSPEGKTLLILPIASGISIWKIYFSGNKCFQAQPDCEETQIGAW